MGRILVTPRSLSVDGHPALARLQAAGHVVVLPSPGRQPAQEELVRLLPGCVGYLAGVEDINATVLAAATDLRVIARNGVGIDNVDAEAAARQGITVCKALGANARGVAELALAHILALARHIPFHDHAIKGGGWERRKGIELAGRTLGVVGCGAIGRLVTRFALALDMRVLAFDVKPDPTYAPSPDFRYASLEEILRTADIITLHCPPTADGRPLIDGAAVKRLKPGVLLVNTARADLIDAQAVGEALATGAIAGVATDVFKTEPPTGDPLVANDRVTVSPHVGGFTDESVDRAVHIAVDNLLAVLGKP